mgnify:FL=1
MALLLKKKPFKGHKKYERQRKLMHQSQKKSKKKWVIGGSLIFIIMFCLSLYSIKNNSVYFYTPKEAFTKASKLSQSEIRIGGMVKVGSVVWKPEELSVHFILSDLKGIEMNVSYKGAPPDMFKEGSGVVVEGYLSKEGKNFSARNLLVKHSEEYKIPGEMGSDNHALLEQSIIKNEKN